MIRKLLYAGYFCLFLLINTVNIQAQTFGAWQIGSSAYDVANDIATDSLGNMYVVGSFKNTADMDVFLGTANRTSNGGADIFLAKYSKYGLLQWVNTIGGSGDDEIKKVVISPVGDIYVCGYFSSTVDFDPGAGTASRTSNGGKDIFFAMYDNNGVFHWVNTIGTTNDDIAYAIALDAGANVCVAGSYGFGSADFDPGAATDMHTNSSASNGTNIFFARYNNAGAFIWAKTLNGCCDDALAIAADASNNVFVGGHYSGCLNWDPLGGGAGNVCSNGAGDAAFAKYDPNGNFLWVKSFGSASDEERVTGIAVGKSGNAFITGYLAGDCNLDPVNGNGPFTLAGPAGTRDAFIAKYLNNGSFVWTKGIGSTGNDWSNAIGIDPGDNIYIGGAFQGLVDFNPGAGVDTMRATVGNYNAFTATYDSSGMFVKSTSSDGGNSVSLGGTIYASKGYTAGYFQGTENLGKYSFSSVGANDAFFAVGCLQPIITSFSPASGPVGTVVTISGYNFDPVPEYNIVHFGSVRATVTTGTLFSLTVVVPTGALYSPISVENMCGLVGYSRQQYNLTFACTDSISASSLVKADSMVCPSPGNPYNIEALDMDGDGKSDLLVTANGTGSPGNVVAYRNTGVPGSISFAPPVTVAAGTSPKGIAYGDMDGDGRKDIVVANEGSGTVVLYLNTSTPGTISFTSAATLTCPAASSVFVMDMDGDGRPDIIAGNNSNNTSVRIFRNNSIIGILTFDNPKLINVGGYPLGVCARDIDGDNIPDLITTNSNTNQIAVMRNTSSFDKLVFSNPILFNVGDVSQSTNFDAGDLDGDGKADIAVAITGSATLALLRNTSTIGSVSFAAVTTIPTGSSPLGVRISDINGDGQPDLTSTFINQPYISIYQNKSTPGAFTFKRVDFSVTGSSWNVCVEDLDGDGKNDLAIPSFENDMIYTLQNVMNAGIVLTASSNSPVCEGSTLMLNGSGGVNYTWTGPNEFHSMQQNPSISNVTSVHTGIYSLTVTNAIGCNASATIEVVVNPKPAPSITASGSTTLCSGNSVALSTGAYASYAWSNGNTTSSITVSSAGTYSVIITDGNTCTGTASTAVSVNPKPTPTVNASGPTTFCQGGSVTLSTGSYTAYNWSNGNTTSSITVTTGGTFTVTVTDGNGCTGTASRTVIVNPNPAPTINASGSTTFCTGGSVVLSTGSFSSYIWSTGATASSITVTATGTYFVTVTNSNGCTGSANRSVNVNARPAPVITPTGSTTFCSGGSVILNAGFYSSYSWSTGRTTSSITVTSSGTYSVVVTNASGCTGTASQSVTVNPPPAATAGSNTPVCLSGTISLTSSGGATYIWSGPNGFSSTLQNPTVPNASQVNAGTYSVTVTSGNGCTATATTTVAVGIATPTCVSCNGNTIVVDQNVTINFNTNPPTYSGDPDLQPFFDYDNKGSSRDQWSAVFNLDKNSILVKNGATITTISTGGHAPGITIWSRCNFEIENGGHIIVNSTNQKAGNIFIQVNGTVKINGEVRDEVSGTTGTAGCVTIATKCGDLSIGATGLVVDRGLDFGACGITLLACGDGVTNCNGSNGANGNIIVAGLVKSFARGQAGNQNLNRPNIRLASFNGNIVVNANTAEPLYDEFTEGSTKYDIYGGLLSWTSENALPGKIEIEAQYDITVNGHGTDPTPPVRPGFGAIAAIGTASNAPAGLVDIRSIQGNISLNDRAIDVSGKNRLSSNYAVASIAARYNVTIARTDASNSFNPVINASSPAAGDKGGTIKIRSHTSSINIGANAIVSAAVPTGSGSVQGVNLLTSCTGITNNGTVTPVDLVLNDNTGKCSPTAPDDLWKNCKDVGGDFSFPAPKHSSAAMRLMSYPNPTSGITTVTYESEATITAHFRLYDVTGKLMVDEQVEVLMGHNVRSIDLTPFSKGIYLLVVESEASKDQHLLLKQ